MWKCPKCETVNNGEECIICGEKKPITPQPPVAESRETVPVDSREFVDDPKEHVYEKAPVVITEKPSKNKGTVILLGIIIFVVLFTGSGFGILEFFYQKAGSELDSKNYIEASDMYRKISFYRNAGKMADESMYRYAKKQYNEEDFEGAKSSFVKISGYKDSNDFVADCDYKIALKHNDVHKLVDAYDNIIENSENDLSDEQLEQIALDLYNNGKTLYCNNKFQEAKECFKRTDNIEDTDKYLRLIKAHTSGIDDVTSIYDLMDFEDTRELLASDKYFMSFIFGAWKGNSGIYLEYYEDDDSLYCETNLPSYSYEDAIWKIENGISYQGSDTDGWIKDWNFEIVNENTITVECYKNGQTYTMKRQ